MIRLKTSEYIIKTVLWVYKRSKFPVGHPKVYVGSACRELVGMHDDLSVVEGLVKCKVPRNLDLLICMHEKLLFASCRSWCEDMNTESSCTHENPADPEFDGT